MDNSGIEQVSSGDTEDQLQPEPSKRRANYRWYFDSILIVDLFS